MSMLSKLPTLDLIDAEILRLEARHRTLQARRYRVLTWQYAAVDNREKGAVTRARLDGMVDATWSASRALHKVYMSILEA